LFRGGGGIFDWEIGLGGAGESYGLKTGDGGGGGIVLPVKGLFKTFDIT